MHVKNYEPVAVRVSMLFSVLLVTTFLLVYPKPFLDGITFNSISFDSIDQIEIPVTKQPLVDLPAPPRPSIPVASESEDIADDITLEEFTFENLDFVENPPPPPKSGPKVKFIAYDDPPIPIGGYDAIRKNVVYPEIAREAGLEGLVVVQFFVDKRGRVRNTIVLKGIPDTGLNDAACEAIRKTRFIPAKQREIPVGVWISVPINFSLQSD